MRKVTCSVTNQNSAWPYLKSRVTHVDYSSKKATIGGASPWRRWINFFGNEPKPPNKIRLLANSRATCI